VDFASMQSTMATQFDQHKKTQNHVLMHIPIIIPNRPIQRK